MPNSVFYDQAVYGFFHFKSSPAGLLRASRILYKTGRGMKAVVEIKPGDNILKIPSSLLISWPVIVKRHNLEAIPYALKPSLPSHLLLTMYIITQLSLSEKSWCFPYIATLPEAFPTLELLYLNRSNCISMLTSPAKEKVLIQQEKIKREFQALKLFVQKYPQLLEKIGCKPPSQFTPDSFHIGGLCVTIENFLWAWLVVNTRSIYLNDPKAPVNFAGLAPIALVPYLDLLNHLPQTKVVDVYDSKSGIFTFVSGQRYQPGEQVFITYGAHDNIALMIEYGFVIPTNPYDYACIDVHIWKYLLMEQAPVDNLDALLAERLSPLPIVKVLQQNDLLRNLAIQSDGEPDFRLMNLLRLWHLPCYNLQTTKHASDTPTTPKQRIQHPIRKGGHKIPTVTTLPEETEEYWLDLWYSIWSGTSETFPEKHRTVEAAAYASLTGILTAASTSTTQKLTQVQSRLSNGTLSLGESDLLHQLKAILDTERSLLSKALIWTSQTHPNR
ncbi:SET domain-containing protein 4, variant 2 [Entomophthora muscae]|uniref:SET domain-containing protein 4, variant 2 n=1 Tax=Entomophthora muscae TaxID=34485 RepID=A0ACC2RDU0_9FUNG|nr:SET domain-containing protein 4, variant 2 [Entomophthora muscae]